MEPQAEQLEASMASGYGRAIIAWEVDEHPHHIRTVLWYVFGAIVAVGLILFAVATANYTFAVVIMMIGVITLISTFREPDKIDVVVTTTGIVIENSFYGYQSIKDFSIIYEPPHTKVLYLDFVTPWHPLVSVPLEEVDPNRIREVLLTFCMENLERQEETLTDVIRRVYKV